MKWETGAAIFAGVAGLLAGCGVIPSGIGFFVVLLVVGIWAAVARRREQPQQTTAGAAPPVDTRSYPTVVGRIEVSRPTAQIIGALFLGTGVGLIGHLIGLW